MLFFPNNLPPVMSLFHNVLDEKMYSQDKSLSLMQNLQHSSHKVETSVKFIKHKFIMFNMQQRNKFDKQKLILVCLPF